MTYRLLAVSLEGTMLKRNGKISRATREALTYVKQKGVYPVIVTHQSLEEAKKAAKVVKVQREIVCYSGAYIAGIQGQPLFERRMPTMMVCDVIALLDDLECQLTVQHEHFALMNRVNQPQHMLGKWTMSLGETLFYPETVVDDLAGHIEKHQLVPLKVKAVFPNEKARRTGIARIEQEIPDIRIREKDPFTLEFTHVLASKADAVAHLAAEIGVEPHEIVAIGSEAGDEELLEMAGLGVAMGGAPESIRQAADWLTRSPEQEGLSYMVKEVFRMQMNMKKT
ncbi:hypothetical protein B0H94_107177 [Salsuginibacillus halophilus]|uniref:Cof subfamily protein (Haloacid dehalogenase superfamily)/HAD superfamily hydrolase (TIGR01484 family) n=1 Tax=Salsuginibacillus halophilus TaxID=517424 RepID=A0A2P8HG28_9BACI|nr:HAD family hydrolase [Salsuginibacillus halophilus]PSL45172.1 hypothetical protein B0H94_107177 [Salsuginibacillus halophilus]